MKIEVNPVKYEREGKAYRTYEENPQDRIQERVKNHYYNQHQKQTVEFVKGMVREREREREKEREIERERERKRLGPLGVCPDIQLYVSQPLTQKVTS